MKINKFWEPTNPPIIRSPSSRHFLALFCCFALRVAARSELRTWSAERQVDSFLVFALFINDSPTCFVRNSFCSCCLWISFIKTQTDKCYLMSYVTVMIIALISCYRKNRFWKIVSYKVMYCHEMTFTFYICHWKEFLCCCTSISNCRGYNFMLNIIW